MQDGLAHCGRHGKTAETDNIKGLGSASLKVAEMARLRHGAMIYCGRAMIYFSVVGSAMVRTRLIGKRCPSQMRP